MSFLLSAPPNQPPQAEQTYVTSVDPKLTTLKNGNRIDEIISAMRVETTEQFLTHPVARTVRRDWNIVSAKMYVFCLREDYKVLIAKDLDEFQSQVKELLKIASIDVFSDVDTSWLQRIDLDITIVNPMGSAWLRALKTWDVCVARILSAERVGFIDRQKRIQMLRPATMAYLGFKSTAMKGKKQSLRDLVEESELM